ncbi:histidine phosphatase family protein [Thermanaerovibrio acidaminovorans]|jgi:alpha-ribazole phosphatase/probable phosphoglycerate mutase|uniref:histidine phosphatase family protein n=1 Tax=Thermanaerovibrio acidaminovorans TaxID=81462 RepID=UPI0001A3D280|nr:histidine phosphatase family protein [Thermanaerovibrio acidaminovorans]
MEVTLLACRILLVRHGRTGWNASFRYQGRTDVPCDEEGMKQVELTVRRIVRWEPTGIYSSPLVRARCLGEALAEAGSSDLRVDPRLTELDFGRWEGLTVREIEERYGEEYRLWRQDPFGRTPPGGEDLASITGRLEDFVESSGILGEERAVLVSHGYALRVLMGVLLKVRDLKVFWHLRVDNCSISAVDVYGDFRMLCFTNDRHHLMGYPDSPLGE